MSVHFILLTTMSSMKKLSIFTVFLCVFCCSPQAGATSPNMIMVLIDDMGWGNFSCFGNREARTPNVDRLTANPSPTSKAWARSFCRSL